MVPLLLLFTNPKYFKYVRFLNFIFSVVRYLPLIAHVATKSYIIYLFSRTWYIVIKWRNIINLSNSQNVILFFYKTWQTECFIWFWALYSRNVDTNRRRSKTDWGFRNMQVAKVGKCHVPRTVTERRDTKKSANNMKYIRCD